MHRTWPFLIIVASVLVWSAVCGCVAVAAEGTLEAGAAAVESAAEGVEEPSETPEAVAADLQGPHRHG